MISINKQARKNLVRSALDKVFLVSYILKFRTDKSDANRKSESFSGLLESVGILNFFECRTIIVA